MKSTANRNLETCALVGEARDLEDQRDATRFNGVVKRRCLRLGLGYRA